MSRVKYNGTWYDKGEKIPSPSVIAEKPVENKSEKTTDIKSDRRRKKEN